MGWILSCVLGIERHYLYLRELPLFGDLFISLLSIASLLEPGLFLGMMYGAEWNQPGPHPQGALCLVRETDHKPET